MRIRIAKFYGAGVPAALLLATLLGRGNAALAVFCPMLVFQLLTLGGHETFRVNAAKQMSGGRITFSALIVLALTALLAAVPFAIGAPAEISLLLAAGALLCLTRLACEHAAAHADLTSALVGDALTGIILAAGLLIADLSGVCETAAMNAADARRIACACGLAAVLPLLITLVVTPPKKPAASFSYFRDVHRGLFRVALFPLVCALVAGQMTGFTYRAEHAGLALGLFAGSALMELSRATFRRTEMEGTAFDVLLAAVCMVFAAADTLILLLAPDIFAAFDPVARAVMLAAACALILYGPPKPRIFGAAALILLSGIACMFVPWVGYFANALTVPAAVCMLPDLLALRRISRAKRIRTRARKLS